MPTANVSLLFPTPVLNTQIGRPFTKQELDFCQIESQKLVPNVGNAFSENTYVLEDPAMAEVKKACMEVVQLYMDKVVKPRENITPYITQSWLNYTKQGQFMHKHNHTNSYLSGVIYINAKENEDKIIFYDQRYQQIAVPAKEYDDMNSDSWWIPVKSGDIIVFPSRTTHSVDPVTTEETRISLAFNVFIDGILGCPKRLTELELRNGVYKNDYS